MSEVEARQMAALLARVCGNIPVEACQNDIGQWIVRVMWPTGPVSRVSVKECTRYATWIHARYK